MQAQVQTEKFYTEGSPALKAARLQVLHSRSPEQGHPLSCLQAWHRAQHQPVVQRANYT